MNNLKKLGLTALAGTLATTSAFAGALDVSGTAKMKYTSQHDTQTTGNSFSTDKALGFTGSGEMDNGMTVNYVYTMTDSAFSSTSVKIDMGDAGTFGMSSGTSWAGIGAFDDVMPTAGEEVWDDVDADDNGVVGHASAGLVGYTGTWGGISVSTAYTNNASGNGSDKSMVIYSDSLMDGLQIGIGMGDKNAASSTADHSTAWAKYTAGSVTVGYQMSKIDQAVDTSDEDRDHIAASFAVNENLSVSYGISTVEFGNSALSDEDSSGISASYTMGSITLGAVMNKTDSVAGAAADDSYTEVAVTFAF
jgi:outer membrane protein OmpU